MHIGSIIQEILIVICSDLLCHLFDSAGDAGIMGQLYQIAYVARPASEIRSTLVAGMICHIHAAEHMAEIHFISVRKSKLAKASQFGCRGLILLILCSDIACKSRILRAAKCCPCAGGVLFYTAADVVYYKSYSIFSRMLSDILVSILFQNRQIRNKRTVVRN